MLQRAYLPLWTVLLLLCIAASYDGKLASSMIVFDESCFFRISHAEFYRNSPLCIFSMFTWWPRRRFVLGYCRIVLRDSALIVCVCKLRESWCVQTYFTCQWGIPGCKEIVPHESARSVDAISIKTGL